MNSRKIKPITNKNCTCMNCLQEFSSDQLNIIEIKELGYGSAFDDINTKVILCKKCYDESNSKIWNMKVKQRFASEFYDLNGKDDFVIDQEYLYEEDMIKYIDSLPVQSQELIWNTFATGLKADYKMLPQDWIDYELTNLSQEKCEKYGLLSKEEKDDYKKKFSTCQWPVNRIYKGSTIVCQCPYNAYGKENQQLSDTISIECHYCDYYKKRTDKIKDISNEQFEKYSKQIKILNKKGKI